MNRLLITLVFIINISFVYGQYLNGANGSDACETCKITSVATQKTVSYHQYIVEEFQQTIFDTTFMIQYAIVSEVISMPMQAIAVSFYTNEGLMYMIISDRYYSSIQEAKNTAEHVKNENSTFCNYFIKPCIIVSNSYSKQSNYKSANVVRRKIVYQGNNPAAISQQVAYVATSTPVLITSDITTKGKYRIQFSWTKMEPFETLNQFNVEVFNGGYRQVSKLSFQTKQAASNWLSDQGYNLGDFWIYSQ